ncbi:MAG: ATP-binding protein [Roseinatronobacter sp.]
MLHTSVRQASRLSLHLHPLEFAGQLLAGDIDDAITLQQAHDRMVSQIKHAPQLELLLLSADGHVIARTDELDTRLYHPFSVLDLVFPASKRLAFRSERSAGQALEAIARHYTPAELKTRQSVSSVWMADRELLFITQTFVEFPAQEAAILVALYRDADTAGLIISEWKTALWALVFATLLPVTLSIALARSITRPLQELAMAADLGKCCGPDKGAIRVRVTIPDLSRRPDEIGNVSRTMRGLVNALYDRVEAHERFAADVAHEIKNPLASLHAAASGLRAVRSQEHLNRLLDVIELDVRRLDRLVSDTANASRLDAELVTHDREEFDIVGLLDTLCDHLAQQARIKGVDFIKFLPEDPIRMKGLPERVAQVFVNLISNAISFCSSGDAVRVWVQERQGRALVVVEDTGPGIPETSLKGIFARFYSQRPEDQFGAHSGLGLAISKQIIEAHQGVIWAENIRVMDAEADSPPLGARLVVGLPL